MIEIRHILCPTDYSDISRHALEHAIVLGKWYEAEITAMHIESPMMVLSTVPPIPPDAGAPVYNAFDRERSEQHLRAWLAPAAAAGLPTRVVAGEGQAARCIVEHATALPADLIVIGTHGHSGFERLMLGSVTEKVLRKATCPVMTVPPHAVRTSALPFAHVLCPVDFSDTSLAAVTFALSLAQEADARLTLLHVGEWMADEVSAQRAIETSAYRQDWEADIRRRLAALIPPEARDWCTPETRIVFGKPYREILALARTDSVDVIVMGVRGRNPVDVMLFGSTTNHVVRQATCPVLTLRH